MKKLLALCLLGLVAPAHAMFSVNGVIVNKPYVPDVDIDCDYDPRTDTVSNCKVVVTSNE